METNLKQQTRLHFISQSLGSFYKSMLNYFLFDFYNRFKMGVITTYDKTVQMLKQQMNDKDTSYSPLPMVSLEPSMELDIDDKTNFLWRYANATGGASKHLFDPIYEDDHVRITPGYNRFKGSFTVHMLLSSIYEFTDMQIKSLQVFEGKNRQVRPDYINSFIHIPKSIITERYKNEALNIDQTLDWTEYGIKYQMFELIGTNEFIYPLQLNPIITLTGLGNSSNARASQGELSDFKLDLSFDFEIELPVFLNVECDYKYKFDFNLYVTEGYGNLKNYFNRYINCDNCDEYHIKKLYTVMSTQDGDITYTSQININPDDKVHVFLFNFQHPVSQDRVIINNNDITIKNTKQNDIYYIYIWEKNV